MYRLATITLVVFAFGCDSAPTSEPTSLVAHWGFNDDISTDNSGNGHEVAAFGAVTDEDGVVGKAAVLSGADYLVGNAGDAFMTDERAVSFWFKKASNEITGDFESLMWQTAATSADPGMLVEITGAEAPFDIRFSALTTAGNTISVTASAVVFPASWHHVVATTSGSTLALFVDGDQIEQVDVGSPPAGSDAPIHFGKADAAIDRFFNGRLDEIRLYQRGLASADVDRLFAEGN